MQGKEPFAEIKQAIELFERGRTAATADERLAIGQELTKLAVDQVFAIGLVSAELTAGICIAKTNLGNIPARFPNSLLVSSPVTAMPQTYYFK
jgi:hypothetical protein